MSEVVDLRVVCEICGADLSVRNRRSIQEFEVTLEVARCTCMDDDIREEGYEDGYEKGRDDGFEEGTNSGYSAGYASATLERLP